MLGYIVRNPVVLALSWIIIIFILCATPGEYIPSNNWLDLLSVDKFVHASIFYILVSLLLIITLKYKQSKSVQFVYFLGGVAYGVALEIMQATVFRNRAADLKDIIANTFGCLIAVMLFKKLEERIKNRSES